MASLQVALTASTSSFACTSRAAAAASSSYGESVPALAPRASSNARSAGFVVATGRVSLRAFEGLRGLSGGLVASPVESLKVARSSSGGDDAGYQPLRVYAARGSKKIEGRKLRVAVVGGGPAGGCAAETLAKGGIETFLIERKLDNAKPCGGAIPLCMVGEFDLPPEIIDRKVTKMKMISPSNVAVDVGKTLNDDEYIGMVRREVLDSFLRERAVKNGATIINGLFFEDGRAQGRKHPLQIALHEFRRGFEGGYTWRVGGGRRDWS